MKLQVPNAKLIRTVSPNNPNDFSYQLYAITWLQGANYVAVQHASNTVTGGEDGHFLLRLDVQKDANFPISDQLAENYLRPVVHVANLGNIGFSEGSQTLEVSLYEGRQLLGKNVLHEADADDDEMPLYL